VAFFGFHIDHPFVLFFAIPVLAAFIWAKAAILHSDAVPYPPAQHKDGRGGTRRLHVLTTASEGLMIALTLVALSGPYRSFDITSIDEEGIDVMLAVDISASMAAKDFPPTRLEATKTILEEFVRKSGGNRVGITVFAKRVFTLSPLTTSHDLLRGLIKGLSLDTIDHYKSGGTAIGDAILYAADALRAARIKDRAQVILLLTDGESNDGMEVGPATKYAAGLGIKIDAIGIGSSTPVTVVPDPSDPDWNFETRLVEEPLIAIANASGGRYYTAGSGDILAKVFDELSRLERTPLQVGHVRQKKYSRYPLILAVASLFAATLASRALFLRRPLR
jgi:Ca-activated chloride channel family protein